LFADQKGEGQVEIVPGECVVRTAAEKWEVQTEGYADPVIEQAQRNYSLDGLRSQRHQNPVARGYDQRVSVRARQGVQETLNSDEPTHSDLQYGRT